MDRTNPIIMYFAYLCMILVIFNAGSLWGVFVFGIIVMIVNKYLFVDRRPIRFVIILLLFILFMLIVWVIQMIF